MLEKLNTQPDVSPTLAYPVAAFHEAIVNAVYHRY